jgi:hypothetical protein
MTHNRKRMFRLVIAAVIIFEGLLLSDAPKITFTASPVLISEAQARIGRPLTPMSYAGVARRTTRRAVRGGVYGGAAVYGAGCYQAVDAYGRVYWRCP